MSRLPGSILCLVLLAPGTAMLAQEEEPAHPPEPPPARSIWSLGFGTVFQPRPYTGTTARVVPLPLFNYRRGGFFARGISFGYGFGPSERLNFELFLGPNFRGYEAGDSAALEGMADRDPTAELGGRLIWRPEPLQVSFAATTDVLNVHGGQEVELELSRGFNVAQRLQLVPGVSGIWQSANYTDYYYGVDPDEARLGRPVYMPGSSVSVRGGVRLFRPLGRRWMLLAWALFEAYGSEITDSPIVEDSTALGGFIGFSYTFGQAGPPPGS